MSSLLRLFFSSEDCYVALKNSTRELELDDLVFTSTFRYTGVSPQYSQAIYDESQPGILRFHSNEVNLRDFYEFLYFT